MIHVRRAAAAIASGLCKTVLITHGESGRSGVGRTRNVVAAASLAGSSSSPMGQWANGAADFVHGPGIALHEDLWPDARATGDGLGRAREWAGKNPRATFKAPITVDDVLNSRMIAYSSDAAVLSDRWRHASYTPPEPARDREFFRSSRRTRRRCLSIFRRRQ